MARRVIVRVSPDLIAGMCFASRPGEWWRTDVGLPVGAKCVGHNYDFARNCFVFRFEHESFADVPDGEISPTFDGVSMHAIHLSAPMTTEERETVDRLTAEQWARDQSHPGSDPCPPAAVVGG